MSKLRRVSGQKTVQALKQLGFRQVRQRGSHVVLKKQEWLRLIEASPHTLRHTHIVHALLDRIPITAVQKQVGHKKLTTTQIYSNLAPEQVREAYEGK